MGEVYGVPEDLTPTQARHLFLAHPGVLRKSDHTAEVAGDTGDDSVDVRGSWKDNWTSDLISNAVYEAA
jgi:hypothetical protein